MPLANPYLFFFIATIVTDRFPWGISDVEHFFHVVAVHRFFFGSVLFKSFEHLGYVDSSVG